MKKDISQGEFVLIIALLMSLTALSIDTMLPALSLMREDLHVSRANDIQLVISVVFFGVALGMPFYGPLSDSIGRKKALFLGIFVFILGCFISLFAQNLWVMLLGRLLQGFGAASPRVVNMAVVRDRFSGAKMARVTSFSMTLFIFIPAVAPLLGQGILVFFTWHAIFIFFILFALFVTLWFALRMEETLRQAHKRDFKAEVILAGLKEVLAHKVVMKYTFILAAILASFLGFLSSVQQVLQEIYKVGEDFPLYFAMMALSLGLSSFINGKIVIRFGAFVLAKRAMVLMMIAGLLGLCLSAVYSGVPPFVFALAYFMTTFFCIGMLFGNLNALSMEPMGHMAGIAAAIIGSVSTLLALPFGILIGQLYNGTIYPLVIGFLSVAVLSYKLLD